MGAGGFSQSSNFFIVNIEKVSVGEVGVTVFEVGQPIFEVRKDFPVGFPYSLSHSPCIVLIEKHQVKLISGLVVPTAHYVFVEFKSTIKLSLDRRLIVVLLIIALSKAIRPFFVNLSDVLLEF